MSENQNKRLKQIASIVAIVFAILTLSFGISKFVLNRDDAVELSFYEYRIQSSEILITPETYTGGEVTVEIATQKTGLSIQYKLEGTEEWIDYTGPFSVSENTKIETRLYSETDFFEGPVTTEEIKNIAVAKIGDEYYKTLQQAIDACAENAGNSQTKIEMLANTTENVVIPEGKNILLDLCGATISSGVNQGEGEGTNIPTIIVDGTLNLIDSAKNEDESLQGNGKVVSTTGTAIKVSQTGEFVLGTNESASGANEKVDTTNPVVQGNTYGIEVEINGIFNFYDGEISGKTNALNGEVNAKPNDFMILTKTEGEYDVLILSKIAIITFDKNVENIEDADKVILEYETAEKPTGAKIEQLPTVQREGYIFNGWYTAKENGEQITLETIATQDTTYYAQYTAIKYEIKYNPNTAEGTIENTQCEYDKEITIAQNTFTKTGYTFKQWNTKEDGTGTAYNPGDKTQNLTTTNNEVINLYAIWEDITLPSKTAPTGIGTTNTITVNNNQTDEGSGIEESTIEYAIFNKDTNADGIPDAWSEWQTSNTFEQLTQNTEYQVKTRVKDKSGNGPIESEIGKITTTKIENGKVELHKNNAQGEIITPETSSENTDNQVNSDIYVDITPSTTGTTTVTVKTPEGNTINYTQDTTITTQTGMYEIIVETTDGTNKITDTYYIYVDKVEPTVNPTVTKTTNTIRVNANAEDTDSGIEEVTYVLKKENEIIATNQTGEFTNLEDGIEYIVEITVTDKAGNTKISTETVSTELLVIGSLKFTETTTSTEFTPNTTQPTNSANTVWVNENVDIEFTDGSAGSTSYTINASETKYTGNYSLTTEDKAYQIVITTTDGTNTETIIYYFSVDKTLPTVTINPNTKQYTIPAGSITTAIQTILTATDNTNGSGITTTKYAITTSNTQEPQTWTDFTSGTQITSTVNGGIYYIWTYVEDKAGNRATSTKTSGEFNVGYEIQYNLNGGTGNFPSIRKTHEQDIGLSTDKPTKQGHTFKGWTETENSTEVNYSVGATYQKDESKILYAVWSEDAATTTINGVTTGYETVQEAITAAGTNSGAIVTLSKNNLQESVTVAAGQNIIFDLNGKTLNGNDQTTITNYGTLTITGESGTLTGTTNVILNNGTLNKTGNSSIIGTGADKSAILNNGTCEISEGTVKGETHNAIYNQLGGKLTISGGTIEATKYGIHNDGNDDTENPSTVTITGGTITSTGSNAIRNDNTGKVYVKGGTVEVNTASTTIYNYGSGLVQVDGGTVKNTGTGKAILGQLTGTIEVKSGSVSSVSGDTIYNEHTGNVKVSGGTVTSSSANAILNNSTGTITVTGGTISGTNGIYNNGSGTITLGVDEDTANVNTTNPIINATNYGVYANTGTFNFYDGVIVGAEDTAIGGNVADMADGYFVDRSNSSGKETAVLLEKNYESITPPSILADVVEVGDYVNYDASSNGTKTYTSDDCLTGSGISATISTDESFNSDAVAQWRVLSVDKESGIVELMAADPTAQKVIFEDGDGFVNAETVLNNVGAIYGQGKGATGGRSITVEDVEQYSSYDKTTYANSNSSTGYYGGTGNYTSGYFYKEIKDEEGNVTGYETTITAASSSSPVTMTQTYYYYTDSSYFSNSTIYNMIFKNSTSTSSNKSEYWLASRCVNLYSGYCRFYVRRVESGSVSYESVFYSSGRADSASSSVIPVVSLKSNILTTGQDDNGVWQLKVEETSQDATYYATLADALQNSQTGSTIKVLNSNTETTAPTLASGKTLTLDLNNKTTTLNAVTLTNNGTLTITDTTGNGKITSANQDTITNTGTLTKTGNATIENTASTTYNAIRNAGTATIENGSITATNTAILNTSAGTLTIGINEQTPEVSIINPSITGIVCGVNVQGGTFNFYDGIIKGAEGKSITGTVAAKPERYAIVNGTETINSVKYETSYLEKQFAITFNENHADGATTQKYVTKNNQIGTLSTPTRENYLFDGWYTQTSGGDKITAATIVTQDVTYYAHWKEIVASTTVGGTTTYYGSVQEAINAAGTSTATVTLVKSDITESIVKSTAGNVTLNLNGKTLRNGSGNSNAITVSAGGLTVIGSGSVVSSGTGISVSGGSLTLGVDGSDIDTTAPVIIGGEYGVSVGDSGTFNFYDGIVKGPEGKSISGTVTDVPDEYIVFNGTETIDGVEYETAYISEPIFYLADVVEIGDYVNYDASSNGVKTFTSSDCLAGSSISDTISTADEFNSYPVAQWRVLSVDRENRIVELMSVDPTVQTVTLDGGDGFVNAETVLNNIGAIYGQGKGATGGRSITIEDIEQYSSYDKTTYQNSYSSTGYYGGTKSYNSGYFYKEIKDENGNVTGYETTKTTASSSSPITMTQTFYYYNDSTASSYFSNSTIHKMIFKDVRYPSSNKPSYWLASSCVDLGYSNRCYFRVRTVNSGGLYYSSYLYHNGDVGYDGSLRVVPVVSLKSNILTIGEDSNGVWQLKLEETQSVSTMSLRPQTITSGTNINNLSNDTNSLTNEAIIEQTNIANTNTSSEKDNEIKETLTTQIGTTTYKTLAEAITSSVTGDTIKLLEKINLTEEITIPKNKTITIDLNGKTLTSTSINTITNNGTLTITGTGIIRNEVENGNVMYNTGTINIQNGVITTAANGGKAIHNNSGTLNMSAGKIVTQGIGGIGLYNMNNGKVIMNDGIIETTGFGSKAIYNDSILEINEGKIIVSADDSIGIYNSENAISCVIKQAEIIVEADVIENYELIKNTEEFKAELEEMKPSYGIYNNSKEDIQIEKATIKVERIKGIGILNELDGSIILGIEDEEVSSATPIIYAVSDYTTAIVNTNAEKGKISFYDGRIVSLTSIKQVVTHVLDKYEITEEIGENIINTILKLIEVKEGITEGE